MINADFLSNYLGIFLQLKWSAPGYRRLQTTNSSYARLPRPVAMSAIGKCSAKETLRPNMLTAASTQSLFKGSGCKGRDSDIFRP